MDIRSIGCVIILALLPLSTTAETQAQAVQQPAQIKVSTELIQIRAVVTDRNGNFVDNLSQDDFLLREDGAPQPIAFFSLERIPSPAPASATKPEPALKAPAALPSRSATVSRGVVLLADDIHTSFESLAAIRTALRSFVDEQLTDQDVVCLKTMTGRLGVVEQFTQNRDILRKSIERILPWRVSHETMFTLSLAGRIVRGERTAIQLGSIITAAEEGESRVGELVPADEWRPERESVNERLVKTKAMMMLAEARYQRLVTVATMSAVVDKMSELPGQRMIAMFSDGFTSTGPGGETAIADLQPVISRAARSGVVIYTMNAKGLAIPMITASMIGGTAVATARADDHVSDQILSTLNESEMDLTHGLSVLASETGGAFFNNTNDFSGRLKKMLDDNSVRYELAYYPPLDKDPDKTRNITVSIKNHPEYRVRAQKSYVLSKLRQANPEPEPRTAQGRLHRAMSQPLPVTDVRLSASVVPVPNTDQRKLEVWISGEDLGVRSEAGQSILDLEVETVTFDCQGRTIKSTREPLKRPVTPEQMDKLKEKNLQYVSRLSLKPGIYHIRVGVRDASSERMGTAFAWLEIPKPGKTATPGPNITGFRR